MAYQSKCPNCGNTTFEMATEKVAHAKFTYEFIRCASCGTVVGVVESFYISHLIHKLAKELKINLDN